MREALLDRATSFIGVTVQGQISLDGGTRGDITVEFVYVEEDPFLYRAALAVLVKQFTDQLSRFLIFNLDAYLQPVQSYLKTSFRRSKNPFSPCGMTSLPKVLPNCSNSRRCSGVSFFGVTT